MFACTASLRMPSSIWHALAQTHTVQLPAGPLTQDARQQAYHSCCSCKQQAASAYGKC
jgi:hypothetical protein